MTRDQISYRNEQRDEGEEIDDETLDSEKSATPPINHKPSILERSLLYLPQTYWQSLYIIMRKNKPLLCVGGVCNSLK